MPGLTWEYDFKTDLEKKKIGVRVWTDFVWFRIGTTGGFLGTR
jgi:hypothetical protein